jgi:hypothetical protein
VKWTRITHTNAQTVQQAINALEFVQMPKPLRRKALCSLFSSVDRQLQHMVNVLYKYGINEMVNRYSLSRLKRMITYLEHIDYLGIAVIEEGGSIIDGEELLKRLKERYAEKVLLNT